MTNLKIYHLYPANLNLYGDRGNIIALRKRAAWRSIKVEIIPIQPGDEIDFSRCDLLFMGGGQDSDQALVAEDLKKRRRELLQAVEEGMTILAVCGSYQLLGSYYVTGSGEKIGGLELIDLYTEAGQKRLIGNAVIHSTLWNPPRTLAGFENHAGKTYLGPSVNALGKVVHGFGNNGEDKLEGVRYKNIIGTYLHGALLPKNPWLTDLLLEKALAYRGFEHPLEPLDDTFELNAHNKAVYIAGSKKHKKRATKV